MPTIVIAGVSIVLTMIAGWLTNLFWLFKQGELTIQVIFGIIGAFLPPVGALHGIYLWFV